MEEIINYLSDNNNNNDNKLIGLEILCFWLLNKKPSYEELTSILKLNMIELLLSLVINNGVTQIIPVTNANSKSNSKKERKRKPPQFSSDNDNDIIYDQNKCECYKNEESFFNYNDSYSFYCNEKYFKYVIFIINYFCDHHIVYNNRVHITKLHLDIVEKIPLIILNQLRKNDSDINETVTSSIISTSILFYQLVLSLREKLLPSFESWIEISIEGSGHYSHNFTRKYFTYSLRNLVPLAPLLLRSLHWKNSLIKQINPNENSNENSNENEINNLNLTTTFDLVGKVFLSHYPLLSERYYSNQYQISNKNIVEMNQNKEKINEIELNENTNSLKIIKNQVALLNQESNQSESLSNLLRSYQLKGIEWMLQLWTSGLGGILADEMGLGKVFNFNFSFNYFLHLITFIIIINNIIINNIIHILDSSNFNWYCFKK